MKLACFIHRKTSEDLQKKKVDEMLEDELSKLLVELEKARKENEKLNREPTSAKVKHVKICTKRSRILVVAVGFVAVFF